MSEALVAAEKARKRGAQIGDGVLLWGQLDLVRPQLVTIGRGCLIAPSVIVLCHGSVEGWLPVTIGDYCYIGHGAMILPGAVIGNNCVVGARAVITKAHPIPDNSTVVGNPGRVVKQRDPDELARYIGRMQQWVEEDDDG